jgi:hypothetical protein
VSRRRQAGFAGLALGALLVLVIAPFNLLNSRAVEALLDAIVGVACAWGAFRFAFPSGPGGD